MDRPIITGEGVHFPYGVCWLSLTERERALCFCCSLPPTVRPFFFSFHIKASADWFHRVTHYNVWRLVCFCSQLQMLRWKCQSVKAHARHIISDLTRTMFAVHSREKSQEEGNQKIGSDVWRVRRVKEGGDEFSQRCSAPEWSEHTWSNRGTKNRPFLCFFDRITPKP